MNKKLASLLILALCLPFALSAQQTEAIKPADQILGVYLVIGETTGEKSKVQVYRTEENTYEGRIFWLEFPNDADGNPRLDVLNPDEELRSVRGDNVLIVKGLKYDEKSAQWVGGTIYNPVNGKIFDVYAEFSDSDKLKVRGFMGKRMFGKTYIWEKLE